MKNAFKILLDELLLHGFGWLVGLLSAQLVSYFFAVRGWRNLWGLASSKTVVSGFSMNLIEFLTEGIVGFLAFVLVNRLVSYYRRSARAQQ